MNVFRSISVATRKLSILLTIIVLVSLSLFLYYFKYIPANKERLQHQGFLILWQQASGIKQNLDDLKNYFCVQKKLFVDERNKKGNSSNFSYQEYKDRPLNYNLAYKKGKDTKKTSEVGPCNPSVFFDPDTITFRFNSASDSIEFKIPLHQLFEKVLDPVKAHFFQYHFVVCKEHFKALAENNKSMPSRDEGKSVEKEPHILYYSRGLAVSEEMGSDTSGKMLTSSQFSKIIDLEMNGSSYKAFMLPFQLGHNTLILTGLMPGIEYRQRLQNIPFSTVNAIIIVFILILISLPYIKVFFISPEEHFGIRDIVLLGMTLFAGTAIFLIILQQGLMQTGARLRTKEDLDSLSKNINQRFRNDIFQAYTELNYLDLALARSKRLDSLLKKWEKNKLRFEKDSIASLFVKEAGFNSLLENKGPLIKATHDSLLKKWKKNKIRFEKPLGEKKLFIKEAATDSGYLLQFPRTNSILNYIVHWADSNGQQVYKGLFSDTLHSFLDISNRQYFKDVKAKHLYSFTSNSGDLFSEKIESFTIQPVYSMSTNSFEVNIAVPGHAAAMAAMSTEMGSVMNTIIPRGYGFYIIDNKGLIQFQSEGAVTLQENFLEWINDKQNLINTIKNRQSRYVSDQYIDDRQFSLFIKPIDQLPMHLIVYHCNDFTTASILHVNAFVLFFLFTFLAMLLVFCFIAWNKTNNFSKLNQPVFQYDWVMPGHNKSHFFINANAYLLIYILITIWYGVSKHQFSTIWLMGIVSPIFAVWTLYNLFRLHVHFKGKPSFEEISGSLVRFLLQPYNLIALTFLGLINIIVSHLEGYPAAMRGFISYEVVSFLLIPVVTAFSMGHYKFFKKSWISKLSTKKMLLYTWFWFLSVIAISIIPVTCFFIYAQQKENNLLIKAQQLDMAESIESRLSKFDWFDKVVKKKDIAEDQRTELVFKKGVYDDRCISFRNDTPIFPDSNLSEPYDEVIAAISWRYKSLDNILPGQDTATDRRWFRDDSVHVHPALMRLFYTLGSENKKANLISGVNTLEIKCETASIFEYYRINSLESILIIIVLSLLLLIMFFRLIKTVSDRLFHTWNFKGEKSIDGHNKNVIRKQLIKYKYYEYNGIKQVLKSDESDPDKEYQLLKEIWEKEYTHSEYDKKKITGQEDDILFNQYHLAELYEDLWNLCTKEERYFLYDMSRDGFVNYKRAHLVQQLLYKGLLVNYDNEELKKKNEEMQKKHEELKKDSELEKNNEELKKSNEELEKNNEEMKDNRELKIMSVSFRNYILDKEKSEEVIKLKEEFHVHGTWAKLRTPVLIAITAIGTFLFITQQDIFQRVATLVPTLSALLGLGTLILGSKSKQGSA